MFGLKGACTRHQMSYQKFKFVDMRKCNIKFSLGLKDCLSAFKARFIVENL